MSVPGTPAKPVSPLTPHHNLTLANLLLNLYHATSAARLALTHPDPISHEAASSIAWRAEILEGDLVNLTALASSEHASHVTHASAWREHQVAGRAAHYLAAWHREPHGPLTLLALVVNGTMSVGDVSGDAEEVIQRTGRGAAAIRYDLTAAAG